MTTTPAALVPAATPGAGAMPRSAAFGERAETRVGFRAVSVHAPAAAGAALLQGFAGRSAGSGRGAPRLELAGEYAFLRDLDDELNFPVGWNASLALNLLRWLGVVAEVGGSYRSEGGSDLDVLGAVVGLRATRRGGAIEPWAELLSGVARLSGSAGGLSSTTTEPALQLGVGLNWRLTESTGLRAGLDYRSIPDATDQLRVRAGFTFGFGGSTARRRPTPIPPPLPPPGRRAPAAPASPRPEPAREAAPAPAPEPEGPPAPASDALPEAQPLPPVEPGLGPGRDLLAAGDYPAAAMAFGSYLRENARDRHTLALGLFCDPANLPGIVAEARNDPSLFVLSVSRQGQTCYGVYWGLYRTASDAREGTGLVPEALRQAGPVAVPLSRILR